MKTRERLALVMFLLAVFSVAHAIGSHRAPNTSCSICTRGYAVRYLMGVSN